MRRTRLNWRSVRMTLISGRPWGNYCKENVPYDSLSRMCDLGSMHGLDSKPNSIIGMSRRMTVMLPGHLAPQCCSFPSHSEISGDLNHARVLSRPPSCPGQLSFPLPVLRVPRRRSAGPPAPFSPVASSIAEAPQVLRIPGELTSSST
jgi:hypothetical protein